MLVLASKLKIELVIVLSLLVFSLNSAPAESNVLAAKAPPLPAFLGGLPHQGIEDTVCNLHPFLKYLRHINGLNDSVITKLTTRKL